jgi:hypothetical protein
MFTSLLFLCLKKACTHSSTMELKSVRSQLYLMFKILESVSVLILALRLVWLKKKTCYKINGDFVLVKCGRYVWEINSQIHYIYPNGRYRLLDTGLFLTVFFFIDIDIITTRYRVITYVCIEIKDFAIFMLN